ncbi:nuclear transport factor 2 family protein [Kitasatospora sp. NPDC093550]|uniref:nuclear transport factor 2 family protein n=1 Tax=Kitasatospora sp. NPDC093550 TaxID=3364089 RepID=UPI0037F46624
MSFRATDEAVHRFIRAFVDRDVSLLADLLAEDCVIEPRQPAPDGARYEGRTACLELCRTLIEDRAGRFEPEAVVVSGERATVRWRHRFGEGPADSVRGVTIALVRDGLIVECLGYGKTG